MCHLRKTMNLSSNCITHYTNEFSKLKNVLNGEIYGSYCKEVLKYRTETIPRIVPMISFCDMPIKTYANINSPYGKFGISLSKQWARKNKLTPVLYIDKSSRLLENYVNSLTNSLTTLQIADKILKQNQKNAQITKRITNSMEYLSYSLMYTKHYEDELKRENYYEPNYRFYDEREWRYIPEFNCAVCELKKTEEEYNLWRGDSKNKPLLDEVKLDFIASDIENLIVANDSDRDEMIELIKTSQLDFENTSKEILFTKILTLEHIEQNL